MNELALFAGAGGGILAGKSLGWRTVCAVERDAYAAAILAQRQNDGHLPAFPIWSNILSFDARAWRGIVEVISGGFPCQDISPAGSGSGITGKRSGLWSEMQQPAVSGEEVGLRSGHCGEAVAHASIERCNQGGLSQRTEQKKPIACQCGEDFSDTHGIGCKGQRKSIKPLHQKTGGYRETGSTINASIPREWPAEPRVGRVVGL